MKSIKYFEYKNTYEFERFLSKRRCWLKDIKGFKFGWKKQYRGNFLKTYIICLKNDRILYFSIASFKSFFERNRAYLGVSGFKLFKWYEIADVVMYKVKDEYGMKDEYVIQSF